METNFVHCKSKRYFNCYDFPKNTSEEDIVNCIRIEWSDYIARNSVGKRHIQM